MSKNSGTREKSERELLEDIKNLIILQLSQSGVTSGDIGKALGVKGAQIRKIRSGLHK